jgi:hypothetical protein
LSATWDILGTPVSSTNKSDSHDIIEILLKGALNTIIPIHPSVNENGKISKITHMLTNFLKKEMIS